MIYKLSIQSRIPLVIQMMMIRRSYSQLKNDYAIMAVSLLQRNPIVMRPLSQIEFEYSKYRQNLEMEKARGTFNIAADTGKTSSIGSIPVAEAELMNKLASADVNEGGNPTDLGRKLDRKLYLCLKERINEKWSLPMTRFDQPESALHLEAQKSLTDLLGGEGLELYHLSAAPVAFHMEQFRDRSAPPYGLKHFFFRSQLVAGRVRIDKEKYPEYGWFCKEEMKEKLPKDLFESIEAVISE